MNLFKRAALLRKKNKRLTVPASVKLAAKELRKNKRVGATKTIERGENVKTKPARVYMQQRTKTGAFKGTKRIAGMPIIGRVTLAQSLSHSKKLLLSEIGSLEARKFAAKLKRDKTKIAKEIAKKKLLFRKIS